MRRCCGSLPFDGITWNGRLLDDLVSRSSRVPAVVTAGLSGLAVAQRRPAAWLRDHHRHRIAYRRRDAPDGEHAVRRAGAPARSAAHRGARQGGLAAAVVPIDEART